MFQSLVPNSRSSPQFLVQSLVKSLVQYLVPCPQSWSILYTKGQPPLVLGKDMFQSIVSNSQSLVQFLVLSLVPSLVSSPLPLVLEDTVHQILAPWYMENIYSSLQSLWLRPFSSPQFFFQFLVQYLVPCPQFWRILYINFLPPTMLGEALFQTLDPSCQSLVYSLYPSLVSWPLYLVLEDSIYQISASYGAWKPQGCGGVG